VRQVPERRFSMPYFQVPNRTVFLRLLPYTTSMPKRNPTPDQRSSVPCPSCGVAAGRRCILHYNRMPSGQTHMWTGSYLQLR
jgi:hypothetical protein